MSGLDRFSTNDLMRIASCGGGFTVSGGHRSVDDLMRIASCAVSTGARITFTEMDARSTDDLIRIASCGKGCVIFD
jgi:hypothetical protein